MTRRQDIICDNPKCKKRTSEKVLLPDYLPSKWIALGYVLSKEDTPVGGKFISTHEFCSSECLDEFMKPSMEAK